MKECFSRVFSTVTVKWGSRAGGLFPTAETEEELKCQSQLVAFHMWQRSHKSSKTSALTSRPSEMGFGKWKTILWQSWKEWLVQAVYRKIESCFFLSPPSLFWINSACHAEIRVRHPWGKEIGDILVQSPLPLCLSPSFSSLVTRAVSGISEEFGCSLGCWVSTWMLAKR